ncbi:MAG: flavoprotein [Chloroflexota bacterium]
MDQAQIDQLVQQVLDRLLQRMIAAAPRRSVLMLFSGAGTGYVVGMQAIQWLAQAGYPLTVVMTASARHVIGEDNVRKAGAQRLLAEGEWANSPKLVAETEVVLMPTLSMNTAAHLALGMMDSLIATLALGALLGGKPVLAVCDGANPYGPGGRVFGPSNDAAPLLRARLAENLATLASYGMQMVGNDAFLPGLARLLYLGSTPTAPAPAAAPHKPVYSAGPVTMLTHADMTAFPTGATVRLARGARLTPLAQEAVFRQELTLVYE